MNTGLMIPLSLYAFATSITPGPNNAMLAASGANYGLRPTIPHALGVSAGFSCLQLLACLGIMNIVQAIPALGLILKGLCAIYLLSLVVKLATAGSPASDERGRPLGFWGAVAFQFVNPKAMVMVITAASAFQLVSAAPFANALAVTLVFGLINLPCILAWVVFGMRIGRFLHRDRIRTAFNIGMGTLVAASGLLALV